MPLRASRPATARTSRNSTRLYKKTSRAVVAAVSLGASLLICALVFISAELAGLAIGFMAIAMLLMAHHRESRFWQQAVSYKFKKLEDGQERLAREIENQAEEIGTLQTSVTTAVARAAKTQNPQTRTPDIFEDEFDSSPRAVKPRMPGLETQDARDLKNYTGDNMPLSDSLVRTLIESAVRSERIEVFFQPVVRLPQRKARYYELFARIRAQAGVYMPAAQYMEVANEQRLMNDIDRLLLMQCLKTIKDSAHLEKATPFFINITTDTLQDTAFMKRLLAFLANNRALAPRLIFEIKQSDMTDMHPGILEILRGITTLGCALSVDHVNSLNLDLKMMQVLKIRYAKINASLLVNAVRDKNSTEILRMKRRLEGNGITMIVEKIENERMLRDMLDFDLSYGQGFLFGRPDLQGAYTRRKAA